MNGMGNGVKQVLRREPSLERGGREGQPRGALKGTPGTEHGIGMPLRKDKPGKGRGTFQEGRMG